MKSFENYISLISLITCLKCNYFKCFQSASKVSIDERRDEHLQKANKTCKVILSKITKFNNNDIRKGLDFFLFFNAI